MASTFAVFFCSGCRTFPQSESEFAFCAAEAVKSRLIKHICIVLQNVVSCVCVHDFCCFPSMQLPSFAMECSRKVEQDKHMQITRRTVKRTDGRWVGRSFASGRDSMKINCKKPQTLMSTNVSHSSCAGWLVAWLDGWLAGLLAATLGRQSDATFIDKNYTLYYSLLKLVELLVKALTIAACLSVCLSVCGSGRPFFLSLVSPCHGMNTSHIRTDIQYADKLVVPQ